MLLLNSVIEAVRHADAVLFHKINAVWVHPGLDAVLSLLTNAHRTEAFVFVILPMAVALWVYFQRRRALKSLVFLILAVGCIDMASYRLIKPLIHRPRPEFTERGVILRVGSVSGYSCPSNHAANMFTAAALLGSINPSLRIPFFAAAALVAYSRVYVGVHYPLDVLAGAALGIGFGLLCASFFRRW